MHVVLYNGRKTVVVVTDQLMLLALWSWHKVQHRSLPLEVWDEKEEAMADFLWFDTVIGV